MELLNGSKKVTTHKCRVKKSDEVSWKNEQYNTQVYDGRDDAFPFPTTKMHETWVFWPNTGLWGSYGSVAMLIKC